MTKPSPSTRSRSARAGVDRSGNAGDAPVDAPLGESGADSEATAGAEHVWVVAADIPVTVPEARRADMRKSLILHKDTKIRATDVYCDACGRCYWDVAFDPCEAPKDNTFRRGGPIGTRKKRKHGDHSIYECADLGCARADPPDQQKAS